MSQKVNLNAYFERIGFAGSIAPTLATLEAIHGLHPASIPFENLNPLLGLPVELELKPLEKKLLTDRRGGYCYEHNLLLLAVLRELDFSARSIAARVLWNRPDAVDVAPHHMALLVEIGGATYLVDAGFGHLTLTAPLKLKADVEQATPHETYRLSGGNPDWLLEAKVGDDWKVLYLFDTAEKTVADYAASNSYLSADPASGYRQQLRVALSPQGKRLALRDNRFTTHASGQEPAMRMLTSVAELREVLSGPFGIQLPVSDLLDPALEAILAKTGTAES